MGEALVSTWSWVKSHSRDWHDEQLVGQDKKEDWSMSYYISVGMSSTAGRPFPTVESMRRDIAERQAIIRKRVQLKNWLSAKGASADDLQSEERALLFLFDRLHASEQPASA